MGAFCSSLLPCRLMSIWGHNHAPKHYHQSDKIDQTTPFPNLTQRGVTSPLEWRNPFLPSRLPTPMSDIDSFKTLTLSSNMEPTTPHTTPSNDSKKPHSCVYNHMPPSAQAPSQTVIDWRSISPCSSDTLIERARSGDLMLLVTVPDQPEDDEFDAEM